VAARAFLNAAQSKLSDMISPGAPQPGALFAAAYRRSGHAQALIAAVFTLPLLFVGGSVTTYRVGLAVPDWPSTFGINMFLYDFWNAPFGVQVEHTHRLYGAAVGLATIGLAFWLLVFETRRWVKVLGVVALVAVVVQGVLGGTRVTQVSTFLAAVHGCTGQAYFGLMVALCVVTGRDWRSDRLPVPDVHRFRLRSLVMLALIYLQIVCGAWLRHYGTLPALGAHGLIALAVLLHAVVLSFQIWKYRAEAPRLGPAALWLGLLAILQVVLGISALYYLLPFGGVPRPVAFYEAVIRTGHQTNAALLLASSLTLTLRAFRHLAACGPVGAGELPRHTTSGTRSVPANLEVVA
jgi:cytochrome c oxidase assembly protein subunit 15